MLLQKRGDIVAKDTTWIKFRHKVVRNALYPILGTYSRWRYHIKVEKFRGQEKRPYLILLNHQTPFDQFFVGMSFRGPIYYLATEDLFSNGWVSSLIRYLIAPIPIKKQTTDLRAVKTCMRVAKEGGTIAIAPEGNRTYSGKTEYMNPSIAPLARKLGMPIALYRIEGGYGAQPRWSDAIRRGPMRGYVSRVILPEEYADMTNDELYTAIKDGLYVNEAVCDSNYRHPKLAEYLERAIYVCPYCGLAEWESHRDRIQCKSCHREVQYLPSKELKGVGFEFPYRFISEWYDAQADFINELDVTTLTEQPLYQDTADWYEVILYDRKVPLHKKVAVTLYGDRMELQTPDQKLVFAFSETSAITVLGRNKLNVYHGENIYQFKGGKRFNALKYVHLFNRHKNLVKGDAHVKFLGL